MLQVMAENLGSLNSQEAFGRIITRWTSGFKGVVHTQELAKEFEECLEKKTNSSPRVFLGNLFELLVRLRLGFGGTFIYGHKSCI